VIAAPSARRIAALVLVTGLGIATLHQATPVAAQREPTTTLDDGLDGNLGRIIPRPNSGREPESPSDRGGWLQLSVLVVMVGGLVVIGSLVVRESRKAKNDSPADS
jgi:hypothetical protein